MDERQTAILQTISMIPAGQVCSYGHIAKLAGYPGHARYVGYILKNLPIDSTIPWHRVVNSQGKISFPPNSDKHLQQKRRLTREGAEFKGARIAKSLLNKLGA